MVDVFRPPLFEVTRVLRAIGVEEYRLLLGLYESLLVESELDLVLKRIGDGSESLIPCDSLAVCDFDDQGSLRPLLARGLAAQEHMAGTLSAGEGLTGIAVSSGEPLLVNDAHLDGRSLCIPGTPDTPASLMLVPLLVRGEVRGVLKLSRMPSPRGRFERHHFSTTEFELACHFASAAALALTNAHARALVGAQARTDELTGLANRRAFREQLDRAFALAGRDGQPLSIVVIDGNKLKATNDAHGHAAGDQLIRAFASVLRNRVRASDFVARIGGDEFVVLLSDTALEGARMLAVELAAACAAIEIDGTGVALSASVSVGCAEYDGRESQESLFSRADREMYAAKATSVS